MVVRKMWDGYGLVVVGLCCDCYLLGWWCLIADWTLGSGRAVTCVLVGWTGANIQFDEGTFLSRQIVK